MIDAKKVSVIIVSLNAAKTIERAIESVLNQTYNKIECVVVDGLSVDNTNEIVRPYLERIVFVSENDRGIYDAMNKGLALATGEWILYLGADDILEPDGIESLMADSKGADLVYGNFRTVSKKNRIVEKHAKEFSVIRKEPFTCHQSVMMRKEVMDKLGGFDLNFKILADFDLIQRAYLSNYFFRKNAKYIVLFSLDGISSNNFRNEFERLRIYKKNKSVKYPYLLFCFYFCKRILTIIKHRFID